MKCSMTTKFYGSPIAEARYNSPYVALFDFDFHFHFIISIYQNKCLLIRQEKKN